ncbi:hypothetical protein QTH97_36060 [Variovorax sp. J22R24]|uniref:hypothetical protein n=1 Tax=Variovorax gracilis TaxID=3053502 RepID=UPI002578F2E8|nr:hypothetical protein [Variovorax sp. J22R24]MDM0110348.1 hypothetical protein [Variovorax sp. J22R24]
MTVGERRRALEWAGELLRDLAFQTERPKQIWGGPVPPELKMLAHRILRHYREPWQLDAAVESDDPVCLWISKEPPR